MKSILDRFFIDGLSERENARIVFLSPCSKKFDKGALHMTPEEKRRISSIIIQKMSAKQKEKLKEFIFALKDTSQNLQPVEIFHQKEKTSDQ